MKFTAARYRQQQSAGFRRLRFVADLEAEFAADYRSRRIEFAKTGLQLAAFVYILLLGIQLVQDPSESRWFSAALRAGVIAILLISSRLIAHVSVDVRDLMMATTYLSAVVGMTLLGQLNFEQGKNAYYEGLIFACFHCFIFGGFLLRRAMLCTILMIVIATGLADFIGTNAEVIQYNLMFLSLTIILGGVAAYMLEFADRDAFLSRRLNFAIAERDQLTNLATRNIFNARLNQRLRRAATSGGCHLVLVLLDVDFFKQMNDRRGHATGDKCLRLVADRLMDSLGGRPDEVARWGGDEMIALVNFRGDEALAEQLEALRSGIYELDLKNPGASPGRLTVSIGALIFDPRERSDETSLLQKVDIALYQAKNGGRNQVRIRRADDISAAELDEF